MVKRGSVEISGTMEGEGRGARNVVEVWDLLCGRERVRGRDGKIFIIRGFTSTLDQI